MKRPSPAGCRYIFGDCPILSQQETSHQWVAQSLGTNDAVLIQPHSPQGFFRLVCCNFASLHIVQRPSGCGWRCLVFLDLEVPLLFQVCRGSVNIDTQLRDITYQSNTQGFHGSFWRLHRIHVCEGTRSEVIVEDRRQNLRIQMGF